MLSVLTLQTGVREHKGHHRLRFRRKENVYIHRLGLHTGTAALMPPRVIYLVTLCVFVLAAHVPDNSEDTKGHHIQSGDPTWHLFSSRSVTIRLYQARAIFGFNMSDNIGKSAFPAVQACPSFPCTFKIPFKGATNMPCLIPCAIDQVLSPSSSHLFTCPKITSPVLVALITRMRTFE